MIIHRIKIHPRYVERILSGQKTFEIRKNDRDYQVGDRLSMYPWEFAALDELIALDAVRVK